MALCPVSLVGQQAAASQTQLPPPLQSVRSAHPGPAVIPVRQDDFPAEITLVTQSNSNWLDSAQVTSRTRAEIPSVRIGWAYALPTGLEFHQSDILRPPSGVPVGESWVAPAQDAPPRPAMQNFVVFVEQATLGDGSVHNADHAFITRFYTACCTGPNAGVVPPPGHPRLQDNVPGGAFGLGFGLPPHQTPLAFDVVSFRRTDQRGRGREMPADGDFIAYHGSTIDSLILFSHIAIKGYVSVVGEPDWVKTDTYEFQAKVAPEDVAAWRKSTLADKRTMVGKVLAEKLKMKIHQQAEPQPVYDLVVAKGGPRLMEYHAGDTLTPPGRPPLTGNVMGWFDPFYLTCQYVSMHDLASWLSGPDRAGRVVVDKTGLNGAYNFSLPIPPQPLTSQIQQMEEDQGVPGLQEGLKQLGLQLVPAKGMIDQIVVDHIERPPTN